ncbi:MAG TPA: hypothetical protein PLE99_06830 [Candidatus Thiothrix moscowensis]|uniref:hypothetical protein n=1 Tax=unclassified Thiothrix TaxID=2636184 RepID=UPI001A1AE8F2|nr:MULTISPECIES: hypothetical protein [unclassified Thiothrix]MBJ6610448.1 hypothetical protein [Candidatus Thiothrix moscowensis]HRJ52462.1 hypothetical protein [Candidatus Thiothrix moscowensis]HRJ93352.1 hypothetical protein [Candidatus Thiothrix moscowensis]
MEQLKHDNKFPLLLRQGIRVRPVVAPVPQTHRVERMQCWHSRMEKLFARQAY